MTDMKPLRMSGSLWEAAFIIPIQESSFWSKAALASVLIYFVVLLPFCYLIKPNYVYLFALYAIEAGVYLFCSFKDAKLKEKEYDELILEEETGVEVQEESKKILNLFAKGKISKEEFNSRMEVVFMVMGCGKKYIPRILLMNPHKTIQ